MFSQYLFQQDATTNTLDSDGDSLCQSSSILSREDSRVLKLSKQQTTSLREAPLTSEKADNFKVGGQPAEEREIKLVASSDEVQEDQQDDLEAEVEIISDTGGYRLANSHVIYL